MTHTPPVQYLDASLIQDQRDTALPTNPYATGYGNRIPTSRMIKVAGRWHRVYAIMYSNAASLYIRQGNRRLFLRDGDLA